MKKRIILILAMASVLLSGCGEYENPRVCDYGKNQYTGDPTYIEVDKARPGLKGYEIIETDDGVELILHYDRKR